MLVGFLVEPALLMVLFTASSITQSTSLASIVQTIAHQNSRSCRAWLSRASPSRWCRWQNARVPVDNPATHLELTMIHEAMILEYSGRHLALIEAASLKLFAYSCIGWRCSSRGHAVARRPDRNTARGALVIKLIIGGAALALIETLSAKMRIFRVPGIPRQRLSAGRDRHPRPLSAWCRNVSTLVSQLINLFAAAAVLSFALLTQRRVLSLIQLFTLQGATLVMSTTVMAYFTAQPHLYYSAALTFVLKVVMMPWHRTDRAPERALGHRDADQYPDHDAAGHRAGDFRLQSGAADLELSVSIARGTLGIALACVLLSFLMMITRTKAIPQVIGFWLKTRFSSLPPARLTACQWSSNSASRWMCWSA